MRCALYADGPTAGWRMSRKAAGKSLMCLCSRRGTSRGRDHWSGDGEEGRRQGALRRNAGVGGRGGALKEAGSMRD